MTFVIFLISRNFSNIHSMPGAMETKRTQRQQLSCRELSSLGDSPGPLTATSMAFRERKTRLEPVGQTHPELPLSL